MIAMMEVAKFMNDDVINDAGRRHHAFPVKV
jgi:hypothetical protein